LNRYFGRSDFFLGLSRKALVYLAILILLFGTYIGILLFGENSVMALVDLQKEKALLQKESEQLQNQNQKFQKEYFELKQLEPKE
jgi:cell division protein FtsB